MVSIRFASPRCQTWPASPRFVAIRGRLDSLVPRRATKRGRIVRKRSRSPRSLPTPDTHTLPDSHQPDLADLLGGPRQAAGGTSPSCRGDLTDLPGELCQASWNSELSAPRQSPPSIAGIAARPPRRRSWPPRASPGPRPAARGSPTCHGVLRRARTSEGPPHPTPPHSPARLNPLTTGGARPFSFWACPGRTMGWVIRRRHAARTAGPPARGPRT